MTSKILLLILTVLVISGVFLSKPRIPAAPSDLAEVEQSLENMVRRGHPPGLSVVVVKDGAQVYSRGFGSADQHGEIAASPETVYHWWSLTKIPTAVAVLQLYDEGLLDLDEPVRTYLPFFNVELDGEPAPPISIRQLLRHTSGLADPMPAMLGWVHYEDDVYDQTDLLRRHLPSFNQLKFPPGSDVSYSNLGYMVLGAVIEEITQVAYEDHIEQAILKPLGMTGTGFLYNPEFQKMAAAGSHPIASYYTPLLPFLLDMDRLVRERAGATWWFQPVYLDVTPSSGLLGSVEEAGLLARALLDGHLLSAESRALMEPLGVDPDARPLGWAEFNLEGRSWVQHQGGGPGFAALMRLYPDENLAIVLMANSTHLPSAAIADSFAALDW